MKNLRVSLIQGETRWHDPAGNRDYYADLIGLPAVSTEGEALGVCFTASSHGTRACNRAHL